MGTVRDLSADERRFLEHLRRRSADLAPVVAAAVGQRAETAASRCERLERLGYVERVTAEDLYRLTDAGESSLDRPFVGTERPE